MQSLQILLTSLFYIIYYTFVTFFIFDFLYGLSVRFKQISYEYNTLSLQQTHADIEQSNSDEATLQYLDMVGSDIDDFDSIEQARQFLDQNAPWTIEIISPNIANGSTVSTTTLQPDKLNFETVKNEFLTLGLLLEKHRSGHNRYRVNVNNLCQRFKTLQDALNWLEVSKKLIQVAVK